MKSPLLTLPGAVPAEGVDEGVAAHYGDLFREQRALADGTGFVDLSHRGVVTVSGPERLGWLHLLLTQHVQELPPHQATEALILSANGHIEHALYLVDDGETTWAHVEPGTQEALVAYLESMKFFYRVEVADRTADIAVVHLPAGSIAEVPEGVAVRETPYGRDLFLPRGDLEEYARKTAPAAGLLAYEALRVEQHRPRLGFETDHRTIPHELGWIGSAVHLQKGCYRGQETVARVQNLGKPPRRLVFLHLDGSEVHLPVPGTELRLAGGGTSRSSEAESGGGPGGRKIGFITTSVRHHELGPVALALVKRNVPVDARLLAGDTAAAQETVVEP
ncbi:YgfZ/GcvT domain-containing protein [Streptomyces albogriseolus]|uniref:CAF17-like 4Fe-4S cluster assembly/insertion protein YgfZ n=1 Tax=Streptomyces albogriseolus TaxID=1887 RepID=UPI003D72472C